MNAKFKKHLIFLASLLLTIGTPLLSSCNGSKNSSNNNDNANDGMNMVERTVNPEIANIVAESDKEIKISYELAAYGSEWIKRAVEQFNYIYEGHGYKAVIGRNDANFQTEKCISEITRQANNDYDLYFDISENILTQLIEKSYSILKDRNKVLLADLTDVLDSCPIDLAGYEEEGTIRSHMSDASILFGQYVTNPESKWYGKTFAFQWTRGIGSFGVNLEALKECGFDEAPRTTDEFYNILETVNKGNFKSSITGAKVYPMTWAGANASGWWEYPMCEWLGQWKGYQGYNDFYALKPATGNTIDNGYDVYDDIGIQYVFDKLGKFCDEKYACPGTVTTIDHIISAQCLADREALFCLSGDWFYNVLIGTDYTHEELKGIEMLHTPVMSELADLVKLPGDTAKVKDQILSEIIKGHDNDEANSTIIANVKTKFDKTVTEEQVERIRQARGIYFDLGVNHQCLVPSYSDNIEGAKLFLRFIFSKDFNDNVYSYNTNTINANMAASASCTPFIKSIGKITQNKYANPIESPDQLSQIRMNGGITFTYEPYSHWNDMAKGMALHSTGYDAETMYNRVKKAMKDNWESNLIAAGLIE